MKKIAIALITALLLTSTVSAVVGHNGTENGLSITSGSSASASAGTSPNGTVYKASVSMEDRKQNNTAGRIQDITHGESNVTFKGTIEAGTPCHVINHEVEEKNDSYTLNVKTVKEELDSPNQSGQLCAQVVTGIEYSGEFQADPGFNLEVQHNGETVEKIKHQKDEKKPKKKSFLQNLLSFLGL